MSSVYEDMKQKRQWAQGHQVQAWSLKHRVSACKVSRNWKPPHENVWPTGLLFSAVWVTRCLCLFLLTSILVCISICSKWWSTLFFNFCFGTYPHGSLQKHVKAYNAPQVIQAASDYWRWGRDSKESMGRFGVVRRGGLICSQLWCPTHTEIGSLYFMSSNWCYDDLPMLC